MTDGRVERDTHEAAGLERPYRLALPDGPDPTAGLVVMLHGCTQDAEDVAAGTGWDGAAGREGWAVLYPEQVASAHPQTCWRWWDERHRRPAEGEAALVADLVADVAGRRLDDDAPVWIAGLSAGAAMALNVFALRPDAFRCVGLHSGVPFAAARTQQQGLAAMAGEGPGTAELARRLHRAVASSAAASSPRLPPLLVVHGTADEAVDPSNARRIVGAWIRGAALLTDGSRTADLPAPDRDEEGEDGRPYRRRRWTASAGRGPVELWQVEGLGHAWSGGRDEGSYADPLGPSATAAMVRFFRREAATEGGRG